MPLRRASSLSPLRLPRHHANNTALKRNAALEFASHDVHPSIVTRRRYARILETSFGGDPIFFAGTSWKQDLQTSQQDCKPPDERALQLGRTIRTLHEQLPTLLISPLPSEILSPQISLHLFPSTHPHLPAVSGRLAYVAALWTAPVAWGRVPLVGNVKLTILSERMVRNGCGPSVAARDRDDKLIVKWQTCGKTEHRDGTGGIYSRSRSNSVDPVDRIRKFIAGTTGATPPVNDTAEQEEEFCGIFVFEFDEKGRIVKHVIEHTEEGGHWDKTNRVVSVTDWLLGQFNGKGRHDEPALAICEERPSGGSIRLVDRRRRFA